MVKDEGDGRGDERRERGEEETEREMRTIGEERIHCHYACL